jgi:Uma2 family endonuclease
MSRVSLPTTRFTVDEFFRLVEADALGTTRVELISGRIYRTGRQAVPHMTCVSRGFEALMRIEGPHDWIIVRGTIILDRFSAPGPDLLWLPCPKGTPVHLWPDPILIVEISERTYHRDSGVKLRKYAFHGLPEYWIENLQDDRIEVYRQPQNPTGRLRDCHYASVQHFSRGQTVSVAARAGVTLSVDELLA